MDKVKLFYLRNQHGHPVACVASGQTLGGGIGFAISAQNPLDNFNRKKARTLATDRLKGGATVATVEGGLGVKRRVMAAIINTRNPWFRSVDLKAKNPANEYLAPQRAREAARLWLAKNPPKDETQDAA